MDELTQTAAAPAIEKFLFDRDRWKMALSGTEEVYRLEKRFKSLVGLPYALSVCNATLGLWAIIRALNIRRGEILTTPLTWGGSLSGILGEGHRPVFADVSQTSLNLDPEQLVKAITPRTRAILAVDLHGYPSDGEALRTIADDHGLVLIQDCAQSFGAFLERRHTGWYADAAVFSFGWGKALFAGEGGMIVTRNEELYHRLVWQTHHSNRQRRDCPLLPLNELAFNLRLHPLSAVWACAVFDHALNAVEERRTRSLRVLQLLTKEGVSRTKLPNSQRVRPSFHAITFESAADAAGIERLLDRNGWAYHVASPPIMRPIYQHEAYRRFAFPKHRKAAVSCPVAERQSTKRFRLIEKENSRR